MGKGRKKEKVKGPNRGKVKAGDTYTITNAVEVVDVDADGVADLVAKHTVLRNGAKFVTSETIWWGLDDEAIDGFLEAFEAEGIVDETFEVKRFGLLNKAWKRITRFLGRINKLAEVKASELGEEE